MDLQYTYSALRDPHCSRERVCGFTHRTHGGIVSVETVSCRIRRDAGAKLCFLADEAGAVAWILWYDGVHSFCC